MTIHQHTITIRAFISEFSSTRFLVTLTSLLGLFVFTPNALALCDDGQKEVAGLLMEDARVNADDIEKLVLLKQSAKACPDFLIWLELGRVQLSLDNIAGAVSAFESARDYYLPDSNGSFTVNEVKRQAIGNAWLAEAYRTEGKLAFASVAAQEARTAFQVLNQQSPQRLVRLQAEIDDAMADADASVLARSFEIQHQRATRGIGVRPRVRDSRELVEGSAETANLEAEYSGTSVASMNSKLDTRIEGTSDTMLTAGADALSSISESRLNIPVLFDYNSSSLSSASKRTVEQLGAAINILKLNKTAKVEVIGHTDSRGSSSYNQQLSVQRASTVLAAIRLLLQTKPIIKATGRGEEELRYVGNSEDDHRRNRRVEIIVIR